MTCGEPKTVDRKMAMWCNPKKHLIPTGGQYVVREDGSLSCVEHKDVPCPLVNLAGSLA